MKNTVYLLTGAAEYLGGNVAHTLISQGKRVRALVPDENHSLPRETEIVVGNILDRDALQTFFSAEEGTTTIVIHCAGVHCVSPKFSPREYDIIVTGTQNIVGACVAHHVSKLVYVSSTSAIPERPKGKKIREASSFDPNAVTGFAPKIKAKAAQLVLDAVHQQGLDASIVFPSTVCGPRDYDSGFLTSFILGFVREEIPSGVGGSLNPVDVRDLTDGIIACAHKGRKGEGYVLGGASVGMRSIFELVSKFTGCKQMKTILSIPAARCYVLFTIVASKFTKKPVSLTRSTLYSLNRNNEFDSGKAETELGYIARPFAETIRDTIAWLKSEGKIQVVDIYAGAAKAPKTQMTG